MFWKKTFAKYSAIKTEIDGIKFHSRQESRRYEALKASGVKKIICQPRFILQPGMPKPAERLLRYGISYHADFLYMGDNGVWRLEDVKGMRTQAYIIKIKLFLHQRLVVTDYINYEFTLDDMERNKISGITRFNFKEVKWLYGKTDDPTTKPEITSLENWS